MIGSENHNHDISHTHGVPGVAHTHSYAHTHGVPGVAHTHTSAAHTHSTGNHTLTTSEMPSHYHKTTTELGSNGLVLYWNNQQSGSDYWGAQYQSGSYKSSGAYALNQLNTGNSGGGGAHNHGNTGSTTPGATGSTTPGAATTNSQSTSTSGSTTPSATTTNSQSTSTSGNASNIQPTVVMNWIVKAFLLMPNQSYVENSLTSSSEINALSAKQGKELKTLIDSKQSILSTNQLNACNSGITAAKVNAYDADISDTGWIKLTLKNGATNFTDGRDLCYRKIGKVVYLSGLITAPESTSVLAIASLPAGFRPHYDYESFVIRNGAGYCKAGISMNGDAGAIWIQGSVAGETSFSNVCFIADR